MRPLAALLLGTLAGCGAEPAGRFSALTYNVAGLPEGISRSSPEAYTPIIGAKINAYDLVLVQEDFSYHHLLDATARHPHRSAPLEDFETLVNDGLNRFSAFPLGPVVRRRWPACHGFTDDASDCLSSKGWSFSEVRVGDGVALHVYNHHAEAGGGPEDVAARAEGFRALAAEIRARSAGRAVIVGGDTNLHHDDPEDEAVLQAVLTETGLADVCRTLACGEEHIDRWLFRSGDDLTLAPDGWAVAEEMVTEGGEPLSDHPAIRADFAWRHAAR